jgi:hypothetical protein
MNIDRVKELRAKLMAGAPGVIFDMEYFGLYVPTARLPGPLTADEMQQVAEKGLWPKALICCIAGYLASDYGQTDITNLLGAVDIQQTALDKLGLKADHGVNGYCHPLFRGPDDATLEDTIEAVDNLLNGFADPWYPDGDRPGEYIADLGGVY